MLPKLIDLSTDMFRLQSCRYNAKEHFKENCARFWTEELGVQYSYCFECSQQGFYSTEVVKGKRLLVEFNSTNLQQLGAKLGESILQFGALADQQEKKRLER